MSVRSTYRRLPPDGATNLQPDSAGSISSPAASANNVSVDVLATQYWQEDEVANAPVVLIQGNISAISGTATVAVQIASDAAFTVPVTVASVPLSSAGNFTIGVDRHDVANALAGAASGYVRLYVTPGSSITYTAFVAPLT